MSRENVRTLVDRSGRSPHLLERKADPMSEKAREVFEHIRLEEPPPPPPDQPEPDPDRPGPGDGVSWTALAVSGIFIVAGAYLVSMGARGVLVEMRRRKA